MQWLPVDSTVIAQIGYECSTRELGIDFHSGMVYLFFDVPPEEHEGFMAAESKRIYLNTVFKSREYDYKIVRDL